MYHHLQFVVVYLLIANIFVLSNGDCSNPPDPTSPSDFPWLSEADSGVLTANILTIVIKSVLVDHRSNASISLIGSFPNCTASWTRSLSECEEIYTANIDWTLLQSCGFNATVYPDTTVLKAAINVVQIDDLGSIRGNNITRTQNTPIDVELTLSTDIKVNSSSVTVFAPISVQAAVVFVGYNSSEGVIQLYTSVQYPFELSNLPNVTVANGALNVSVLVSSTNNCPTSSDCRKTYEIDVINKVGGGTPCWLNGTYTLSFGKVECNPLYTTGNCSVESSETATIIFDVISDNLCGSFSQNIDISANATSSESLQGESQDTFIQGQVMYFSFQTYSALVNLSSTYVMNCTSFYDSAAGILLYSGGQYSSSGSNSVVGAQANFAIDSSGATSVQFHFTAIPALYTIVADTSVDATISCWLGVLYEDVAGKRNNIVQLLSGRRRSADIESPLLMKNKRSSGSSETIADTSYSIQLPAQTQSSPTQEEPPVVSGASALVSSSILAALLLFYFFF